MRPHWLLLIACIAATACADKSVEPLSSAQGSNSFALYEEPQGLFSCSAPGNWRVLERQGGAQRASFFGPPTGQNPFAASISVYFYSSKDSPFSSPQDYAAAHRSPEQRSTPLLERSWKKGVIWEFSTEQKSRPIHGAGRSQLMQEDTILIPAKNGFFALLHRSPLKLHAETRKTFDVVLNSFHLSDENL